MNASFSFKDGFAEGFRIPIPERLASALHKKELHQGDVFYSAKSAYSKSLWTDAVKETDWILQIRESMTGGETVLFELLGKDAGQLKSKGTYSVDWEGFIDLLRNASFEQAQPVDPDRATVKASKREPREYLLRNLVPKAEDHEPPASINFKYRLGREMDELIGICRGVICDRFVADAEAQYLHQWLASNETVARYWPAKPLAARLNRILADKIISDEERRELTEFLSHLSGEAPEILAKLNQLLIESVTASTTLPLDNPPPEVEFEQRWFCFTGKFLSGTRQWCANEVSRRGANVCDSAGDCDFLVIGALGSRDWAHSSFGRKIEAAMRSREAKMLPKIVAEPHWLAHLTQ